MVTDYRNNTVCSHRLNQYTPCIVMASGHLAMSLMPSEEASRASWCLDCKQSLMILSWRAVPALAKKAARNARAAPTFGNEQQSSGPGSQNAPPEEMRVALVKQSQRDGAANLPNEQEDPEGFEIFYMSTEDASTQTDPIVMMTPARLDALMQQPAEAKRIWSCRQNHKRCYVFGERDRWSSESHLDGSSSTQPSRLCGSLYFG